MTSVMLRRCHNLLQDFRRKKLWKEALQLLHDSGPQSDVVAVNCAISACAAAARWQEAIALLNRKDVDKVSFTAAIGACGRAKHWSTALLLLKEAEAMSVDVGLYNAAMAVLKNEQWAYALALFQRIHQQALQPDLLSFNTVLSACGSARRWELVLALMEKQSRTDTQPDVVGISTAISALPTRRWPLSLQLLELAPTKDTVLCGSAISMLSKASQWQNALILFFNMDQLQIKANMLTYSAALGACDKGSQWFLALELLDKSPRKRLDGRAYCSALSACGKASQWRVALDLFRQSQGVEASNLFTFNATLSACEKGQQWPWTLQLLEEMWKEQLKPDLISFNSSILAASQLQWPVALHYFCHLRSMCLRPDTVSFNAILDAKDAAPEALMEEIFLTALKSNAYPSITSSDLNALDLHDLSPGAASCAISWWLRQHGYWSGRHPMGLEIITGQGSFRKGWASGPTLHQAAVRCLATLQVPWAEVSCNTGRLRVLPRTAQRVERPPPPKREEG